MSKYVTVRRSWNLLLTRCWTPSRRYRQALVATVEKPENVATENITDVFHFTDAGAVRLHRPVSHVERCIDHRQIVFLRRVLQRKEFQDFFHRWIILKPLFLFTCQELTKYRSVATDTRIRSSPTRTFSPSDLCLEAGCTVHQHASPARA